METVEIYPNLVLNSKTSELPPKIRVIHVTETKVFFVDIGWGNEGDKVKRVASMPQYVNIEYFKLFVETGELEVCNDPFLRFYNEQELIEIHPSYLSKRDENYEIARYIWEKKKDEFLSFNQRTKSLREVSSLFNKSLYTVRWLIKRYLQRGMNRNALLPDYFECGNPGLLNQSNFKKRGRRANKDKDGNSIEGIPVTPKELGFILKGYKKYYLEATDYITKKKAWQLTVQEYFSRKVVVDGKIQVEVVPGTYPLYDTFLYYTRKYKNRVAELKREGIRHFENNYAKKTGSSSEGCSGPGSVYQIDSTILPVTLVSSRSINRHPIGKAVLYFVTDVYSRLIAGYHLGLLNPSYNALMLSLANAVEDKTALCQSYNLPNTKWTCHHLPSTIVADNGGEFAGFKLANVINNLGIEVDNAPPYSPTYKGIVECDFKNIKAKLTSLPGAVKKQRRRDEPDKRLDARLTFEELEKILVANILQHNASTIDGFTGDISVLVNDVPPIPNELWEHGIEKVGGARKVLPTDIIWVNLLPKGKASINKKGILFDTRYYFCETAFENNWHVTHKGKQLDIAYDPRNVNDIYILEQNGTKYDKCSLPKDSPWVNLTQDECRVLRSIRRSQVNSLKHEELQRDVIINVLTQDIEKQSKQRGHGKIKRKEYKDIRPTREADKKYQWLKKGSPLVKEQSPKADKPTLNPSHANFGLSFIKEFKEYENEKSRT